ncbi:AlkZ-related protein [Paenibacillus gansuensis]|uniref:Uncharacterized protein n=1 Tax=Paenibacillus gansuensis TaxID=306542 RepID=A0ABW5PJ21_9BACL
MNEMTALSYEQVTEQIRKLGILPMAGLLPEYPSLESLTLKEDWHSGTERDPWLWRVQFPGDGTAAYGKMLKKKNLFIAAELYPLVQCVLSSGRTAAGAYKDGLLSRNGYEVYKLVEAEEGIDTRELRARAGMKEKEQKKAFEDAVTELQSTGHIVISGVKVRLNGQGEQSGWNSTSFETAQHWMEEKGLAPFRKGLEQAREELAAQLKRRLSAAARAFVGKAWKV